MGRANVRPFFRLIALPCPCARRTRIRSDTDAADRAMAAHKRIRGSITDESQRCQWTPCPTHAVLRDQEEV